MKGTSFSQTLAMVLTPPKITTATRIVMTMASTHLGMRGKLPQMMLVIAEDWTAEPVPRVAMTANRANKTAPAFAHMGVVPSERLKARSQAYMAPPIISPLWSFTRYRIEA